MINNSAQTDISRKTIDFRIPKVVDVLPEYFRDTNPLLIKLLDYYMDYMDSDAGFNQQIRSLNNARDIRSVSLSMLDYILQETGLGITSDKFTDPRTIALNFPKFFRYKGSTLSTVMFFRALFDGEEIEIIYPKENLIIVGGSRIGPEYLNVIQNGKLYQVLSILIKTSKPINQWRDLYKAFVHPAGFYLGAEVFLESIGDFTISGESRVQPADDTEFAIIELSAIDELTGVTDPITLLVGNYRINTNVISSYDSDINISNLDNQYDTIIDVMKVDRVGFDDSNLVDWSNTIEVFDANLFDS